MSHEKLRRQILYATARLLITQQETQVGRARIQAARKLYKGWVKPADMPTDREIHAELDRMSNFHQPAPEDRFVLFRQLLVALEKVQQRKKTHPEGDALTHSLQVYDLVYDEVPYDEELLLAALLHDVGKGIDPHNHVEAGLGVLGETITERTAWLITHCHEARKVKDGTIGVRARRRLQDSENYEDVILLAECDLQGRQVGVSFPDLDEALTYIQSLEAEFG
jgi:predicted HD phosphohydrolase